MTVNDEEEEIWKQVVIAYNKTHYHHSPGGDNLKRQETPAKRVNLLKQIQICYIQNMKNPSR
jgi:hypothetical protein